ncbi:GNAT family N-acetyltransferase [Lentilactobacillus sunkii]|uniref:Acetyltransferase n=1 Tax=Lentilactobacillus sunkii DSM 19904 TaxID=1423808 RepID=A0A0R1LCQ1_9LACO|nr:GNAT family N-acetyltransferase [Lentilactobacillus sunkii]KRK90114.1 acetyltransferase [Lentilactobacillus sunkii DSM 19904]
MQAQLLTKEKRTTKMLAQLIWVWESSVKKTHHFLSDEEIQQIKPDAMAALKLVPTLVVMFDSEHFPVGFMGIDQNQLEMLFIEPGHRGQGIGKQLIQLGISRYGVTQTTVNEQNTQALEFYQHMGFYEVKRFPLDDQGRPYPLLEMRLLTDIKQKNSDIR